MLDGLRSTCSTKTVWSVGSDGEQRAFLVIGLDECREKFGDGGATGGDDGAGMAGDAAAKGEESGAAFFKVPPDLDQAFFLGLSKSLDECGITSAGADDELGHALVDGALDERGGLGETVHQWTIMGSGRCFK